MSGTYRTSSFCSRNGCVEVEFDDQVVRLRNTDDPEVTIESTQDEWVDFIRGVKAGEFDLPLD